MKCLHHMAPSPPRIPNLATSISEAVSTSSIVESSLPHPSNPGWGNLRKKDLIIFIRVVLDDLEQEDPSLREKVRAAITKLIEENRNGVSTHKYPLPFAVQKCVRSIVGEGYWSRGLGTVNSMKVFSMSARTHEKRGGKSSKNKPTLIPDEF